MNRALAHREPCHGTAATGVKLMLLKQWQQFPVKENFPFPLPTSVHPTFPPDRHTCPHQPWVFNELAMPLTATMFLSVNCFLKYVCSFTRFDPAGITSMKYL